MTKFFWQVVALWFLVQLVFVSAATASNSLTRAQSGQTTAEYCDAKNISPVVAFVSGAVFPITQFSFITAGFCWQ